MTLPKYPDYFAPPQHTGVQGTVDVGLRRTSVPTALPQQIKDYNAPRVEIGLRFEMTIDAAPVWLQWFYDIKWRWFTMDIVSPWTPRNIVSAHTVRPISTIQYAKLGDNWCSMSMRIEVVQNDGQDPFIPEPTYDWIIARTPWQPPPDSIIAKSPDDPAIPIIISHLYYLYED